MYTACKRYRVLVLGLRWKEFSRLREEADDQVDLRYGGHIGDGSNCVRQALQASDSVDVVLLYVNGFRHLPPGFRKEHMVIPVHSVTDALRALNGLAAISKRNRASADKKRSR